MREEIKCNKAHYFFNEILRYNLIKMAAEIFRGNFENFRKKIKPILKKKSKDMEFWFMAQCLS